MKIGLLAYHSAINFGATLQLLSTYCYLKKHGHNPIIINWVAEDMEKWYLSVAPKKQVEMQEKLRQEIWTETTLCRTDEDVAQVIEANNIEAVIIGSDAVAQHHTQRERIVFPCKKIVAIESFTSDRLFPNPFWAKWNKQLAKPVPVCLLSVSNQDSKFKYFSDKLCREMYECVKSYRFISVRDTWTLEMFKHITNNNVIPQVTPDPVFAFGHNASELLPAKEDILARFNLPDHYILMSFMNAHYVSQQWIDEMQRIVCEDGKICIKLPFSNNEGFGSYKSSIKLPLSPIDWFALIKYSDGYIGNNMHPIVSSIHCGTPFFCFDNYGMKRYNGLVTSDKSSKIKHILNVADLSDWRISCINKSFIPPSPVYVYNKLKSFPIAKANEFTNRYYRAYKQTMEEILNLCV